MGWGGGCKRDVFTSVAGGEGRADEVSVILSSLERCQRGAARGEACGQECTVVDLARLASILTGLKRVC